MPSGTSGNFLASMLFCLAWVRVSLAFSFRMIFILLTRGVSSLEDLRRRQLRLSVKFAVCVVDFHGVLALLLPSSASRRSGYELRSKNALILARC